MRNQIELSEEEGKVINFLRGQEQISFRQLIVTQSLANKAREALKSGVALIAQLRSLNIPFERLEIGINQDKVALAWEDGKAPPTSKKKKK